MKFTAHYCRSCAQLNPRFESVVNDAQYNTNMPILWADFAASPITKDYFRRLGVLSLPTVHFYDGPNGLVENFPCGKTKIPVLKMKLQLFQIKRVDPNTGKLIVVGKDDATSFLSSALQEGTTIPRAIREVRIGDELITQEHLDYLRNDLVFLKDLTDSEFTILLQRAKLQSFNAGDIIIRQGKPGRTFYVIKSGRCEMLIRSRFNDPISTPPSYLGAVVNELTKFDYFGERALSTGEPYAATVRVLEKTRCFAFDADIIPESSILSKQRRASRELVAELTQRYHLPDDYQPQVFATKKDNKILELLIRFKQIRQAAKCFEYVTSTEPIFGDRSGIARRSLLVSKLSKSQQEEFRQVFNLVDVYGRGRISLLEMRKFMASARVQQKTDQELLAMIGMATPSVADPRNYGSIDITIDEFMGVMAEAEFYSLFTETFQALDTENIGYVSAGDLDQVLGGVRDLFSDDYRSSLIDVEDKDVQIDYEQFTKMLIGAAL
jgi:calmodulin